MATRRVTNVLEVVPLVILGALEGWVLIDLVSVGDSRWRTALGFLWVVNVALLAMSAIFRWRWARWMGLVALGSTYVAMHALVLGVQSIPALGFVSLLIVQVELRILAERFAPLFASTITDRERHKIGGALTRAVLRLGIASILSIVVSLLAANLSAAGFVPATTVPSAFLLAAALVAVVVLLALLPSLEQRTS